MDIYTDWRNIGKKYANLHLALGNFDGLHLGHQQLIHRLVDEAQKDKGTAAVFTFYPHPLQVLCADTAPQMLLSQQAKQHMLAAMGVDVLLLVPFTADFAALAPEQFMADILHQELGVNKVFVGYNYTFGKGGKGNAQTLAQAASKFHFQLEAIPPVTVEGKPVSSTLIRNVLLQGDVAEAKKYLGYYPFWAGKVVAGDKRGRVLGFPTANICLDEQLIAPANGVYAVRIAVEGEEYIGVANIGEKPTFQGSQALRNLEVHLLDFQGDLYNKEIKVYFTNRLREERRFASVDELIAQIQRDVSRVRTEFYG